MIRIGEKESERPEEATRAISQIHRHNSHQWIVYGVNILTQVKDRRREERERRNPSIRDT